jgi:hypothetical protein
MTMCGTLARAGALLNIAKAAAPVLITKKKTANYIVNLAISTGIRFAPD